MITSLLGKVEGQQASAVWKWGNNHYISKSTRVSITQMKLMEKPFKINLSTKARSTNDHFICECTFDALIEYFARLILYG